ncbi:MAG TPA: hypothetical protein VHD32_10985 [Candidatus Didemnitutus sp.]|nr:hypothetical protein [Candidatus Didemnitutus sp.]
MRTFTLVAAISVLLLAGCDSVSDSIQNGFSGNAAHSRTYHGQAQDLSAAVVLAMKRLDFNVTSPGGAGDHIEASGRIQHSDGLSGSRQLIADVKLVGAGPGETEVQILLTEQSDDGTATGRSEKPVKDSGLYGTFFDTIKQVLAETYSPTAAPTETAPPHQGRD